ncbi:MAG TPA: type II secretion system F family protein [Candidatus Acidoferrales bacterium]|nr:type II secretion system F family protein [Candidatus Acidoferrales bacterium]
MAEFLCRVADASGKSFTQMETANSEAEVRQRLTEKGLHIYSVRGRSLPSLALRWPSRTRPRFSASDFFLFNQQFVTLIRAGLPILRAVELLADRSTRPGLRMVLNDIRERVRGGASLSEGFRAQGLFPEVYISSLLAGERSGNLAGVLEQYIAYQRVTGTVRRRLLTALVYPALLVVVAAGVLSYVTLFVIPRFAELYSEMNVSLPALTVAVVTVALNLRASLLVLLLIVAVVAVVLVLVGRTEGGAQTLDRARMKVPLVGDIILKFRLAQFTRTLSTLLAGGIPLVPSLEVSAGAMGSPVLRSSIAAASVRVSEGQSLHAALARTGIVPDLVIEMIEVGESTGALPQMLNSVAEFYEEDLNTRLTTLLALVEPLLLVVMGGIILVILVALYLPIFSIGSVVR